MSKSFIFRIFFGPTRQDRPILSVLGADHVWTSSLCSGKQNRTTPLHFQRELWNKISITLASSSILDSGNYLTMYLLTAKPSFKPQLVFTSSSTSSSSISLVSFRIRSASSISFPRNSKHTGRLALRVEAYDSSKNDTSNPNGDSKPPNGTLVLLPSLLPLSILPLTCYPLFLKIKIKIIYYYIYLI